MKILAVDDDKTILELLCLAIQVFGDHTVVRASSGPEALQRMAEADTPFDCFLLDIQMPKMTGIDLCGAIRANANYVETPIIMLTAMSDKRYIDAAFSTGATDFIVKPFDIMELKSRLQLAETQALSNRRTAHNTLDSLTNNLTEKNPYKIDEAVPMLNIDHALRPGVFGNYLEELHRLQYLRTRVFTIRVLDIEAIFSNSSGLEFRDHMIDIAETIQDYLCEAQGLLSYFGNGVFCCVIDGGFIAMLEDMPVKLEAAIYNLNMVYRNGSAIEVRLEIGDAVAPSFFTKLSATDIIQKAVSNLGDGQISLPAIKSAG
ncbi:MAG: response regulator [Alphaproteobacteria bacterium]|nr:response regulator [Alphaproteobacteria bacterium]